MVNQPTPTPRVAPVFDINVAHPVVPGGLVSRIRSSVKARKFVPTTPSLIATDLAFRAATRLSRSRSVAAELAMEAVVGGTGKTYDIADLGRRHVASMATGWELTWRPWELAKTPVTGLHALLAAAGTGRGVLTSYIHYGPEISWVALPAHLPLLAPLGDWIAEPPPPGYGGYQVEHRRKVLREAGFELAHARNSARKILTTLKSGGAVHLAMDLPGPRVTDFLSKPVEMADGTARLAFTTKSLVAPVSLVPVGRRWRIQIHPVLDPLDFPSAADLHQALADVHTLSVLGAPEHLSSPLRPGFWARANGEGWFRA